MFGTGIHPNYQSGWRLFQQWHQSGTQIQRTRPAEYGVKVVRFVAGPQLNLSELQLL